MPVHVVDDKGPTSGPCVQLMPVRQSVFLDRRYDIPVGYDQLVLGVLRAIRFDPLPDAAKGIGNDPFVLYLADHEASGGEYHGIEQVQVAVGKRRHDMPALEIHQSAVPGYVRGVPHIVDDVAADSEGRIDLISRIEGMDMPVVVECSGFRS